MSHLLPSPPSQHSSEFIEGNNSFRPPLPPLVHLHHYTTINGNGNNNETDSDTESDSDSESESESDYVESILNLPPSPDFSFINDESTRYMISSAYDCVTIKKAWECIKLFRGESFMFCKDNEVNNLMNFIDSSYDYGHSGSSIGFTMRQLQLISNIGFDNYKNEWINKFNK